YVMGNHDYGYRPPDWVRFYPRGLRLEVGPHRWFALHGDILDFPYLFALLKQGKLPLSRFKRWTGGEYENVYRVLSVMPKDDLYQLLAGRFSWRLVLWAVPLLYAVLQQAPEVPVYRELRPGPLIPTDVQTIAERVLAFHPEAERVDGLVLGHLHRPMQGEAVVDGHTYRVQVLGAWCDQWPRTVGVLDDAGFRRSLMLDFVRSALDHLTEILAPSLAKAFGLVLAYMFVGPAILYHLAILAVVLDTLTGIAKAISQKNLTSHTLRVQTMAKLFSYSLAIVGASILYYALNELGIDPNTTLLAVKFTLVSVIVTEVLSMWENIQEITGQKPVAAKAFDKLLKAFNDQLESPNDVRRK
ncbi:phage holin family protein, partial [Escherichia coli]|uniref:phage holin family protein n=1 Tax=Escherichia coli TaxID=562 RepID=UPI0019CFBC4A